MDQGQKEQTLAQIKMGLISVQCSSPSVSAGHPPTNDMLKFGLLSHNEFHFSFKFPIIYRVIIIMSFMNDLRIIY